MLNSKGSVCDVHEGGRGDKDVSGLKTDRFCADKHFLKGANMTLISHQKGRE